MDNDVRQALEQLKGEVAAVRRGETLRPSHEGFHFGPIRLFVKLVGTAFHLFQQGEDGTEIDLTDGITLQGVPVSETAPTTTQVLTYNGTTGLWEAAAAGSPGAHKTTHQDGGADEISVAALSGLLADDQHVLDAEVTAVAVALSLYDAATFLYATNDNTPQAKTRAEVMAILSGQAAAAFAMNSQKITGLAAGSGAGDSVRFEQLPAAASTTVQGIIEVATAAETTTGTDAGRAVSPDGLAGSDYGKRIMYIKEVVAAATALTTGDAKTTVVIPSEINGWLLVNAQARVYTAGTGATKVNIQVRNVTDAANMLSTAITLDDGEATSYTAATQRVIDGAQDDVLTGEIIAIDIDAVGNTTPGNGLDVILTWQLDPA